MKRLLKGLTVAFAMVCLLVLVSCSKITQSYADKINDAFEAGEPLTLEEVKDDLGDYAIPMIYDNSGEVMAVKGVKKMSELMDIEEDEKITAIVVIIKDGKAVRAVYYEGAAKDLSKQY